VVVILALVILPIGLVEQAKGQSVDVIISRDTVTVNMHLVLKENLTSLPLVNVRITSTNSTYYQQITNMFNKAIQTLVPTARIAGLDLHAKTSNSTGMWLLEDDYSIVITGTNANSGSRIESNLGFIPLNISQSLRVGGAELNAVGPILIPALEAISSSSSNILFFIDGSQTRNSVIPAQTTEQTWLLDLHWVTPVSTWTTNMNLLGQYTSWSFTPTSPRFNLTLGLPSPEGPLLKEYTAIYSLSIRIALPTNAWVNGNTVSFDIPTSSEIAMAAIPPTTLIISLATFFADRRIAERFHRKKKKG
jgi:hypothetical protein